MADNTQRVIRWGSTLGLVLLTLTAGMVGADTQDDAPVVDEAVPSPVVISSSWTPDGFLQIRLRSVPGATAYLIYREIMVTTASDGAGGLVALETPTAALIPWGQIDAATGQDAVELMVAALDGPDDTVWAVATLMRRNDGNVRSLFTRITIAPIRPTLAIQATWATLKRDLSQ